MKYIVAFLLLFALTTELHLKSKTKCRMSGEKCILNAQCCGENVCLSKKGHVCGSLLEFVEDRSHFKKVGEECGENGECRDPYFCYDKKCTEPFEKGHECKHDYQCKSDNCMGSWGGIRYGKCI